MSEKAYRAKELVWENFAGGMACDSMIGFYRIWFGDGKWVIMLPRSGWCKAYLSLEEAKEACQQHYNSLWQSGGTEV